MSAEVTASASARPACWAKTALRADREVAWDRIRKAQANLRKRVGKSGRAATKSRRSVETSNYQRWYRPNDGRYLSPDPIGLAGGEAGFFAYAGGRPLVAADSDGLIWKTKCGWKDGRSSQSGSTITVTMSFECETGWVPTPYDQDEYPYTSAHEKGEPRGGGAGGGTKPKKPPPKQPPAPAPPESVPPIGEIGGFPHEFPNCGGRSVTSCRDVFAMVTGGMGTQSGPMAGLPYACGREVEHFMSYVCPEDYDRWETLKNHRNDGTEASQMRTRHSNHRGENGE